MKKSLEKKFGVLKTSVQLRLCLGLIFGTVFTCFPIILFSGWLATHYSPVSALFLLFLTASGSLNSFRFVANYLWREKK
jgi:hypothetical protein